MYSAAMSPPRWPVPRPSSKSLARNFTCARIFSASGISIVMPFSLADAAVLFWAASWVVRTAATKRPTSNGLSLRMVFFSRVLKLIILQNWGAAVLRPYTARLFLCAVLQQIFQLAHEFLDVFEIHVDAGEAHVGDFIELFEAVHDHFADFGGGELAFGGFVHDAFDFVDDAFEFRRGHRALLAGLQQALQNFLTFETLAAAIFLDDHVGDFVDSLVGGEAAAAFEAFAAAANGIAAAAFAGINHLVVDVRAERAFHSADSPGRVLASLRLPAISWATISSSCLAISRNWPSDQPS